MSTQNWFEKYWQWAISEVEFSKASWHGFNDSTSTNVLSLKLQDLCCPLFPVDPEPPKRISDERLHQLWQKYSKLDDPPTKEAVATLLSEISKSDLLSLFPEFDLIFVAKALALARVSRFSEAEEILESAFRKCRVRSALCNALGSIKLWQGETVAIGWFMQACLLGYETFLPYLQLSEAANTNGMVELGNRLLNASDIISSSMNRLSPESAMRYIAQKDSVGLHLALVRFLDFADRFLPPTDILPPLDDQRERSVWLILIRGDPYRPSPTKKILDRSFAH
jgi:hypothetical protein